MSTCMRVSFRGRCAGRFSPGKSIVAPRRNRTLGLHEKSALPANTGARPVTPGSCPRIGVPSTLRQPKVQAAGVEVAELADSAVREEQQEIDWFDQWYAVSFVGDLKEDVPNAFTVMEQPIVVWRDESAGTWRAFRDSCPHRLVPLSEGRIDPATGQLECPYHGWQFDDTGKCTVIPEGGKIDHRCDVIVYPCAIKQGMMFVKPTPFKRLTSRVVVDDNGDLVDLDNLDTSGIPIVPELDEGAISLDIARDFPYDYSLLVENLADVGHVHFTHHGTISRREKAPITTLTIEERGAHGFSGGQVGKDVTGKRHSLFQAPTFLRHTIDNMEEKGSILMIVVYAVPVAPGRCRLLNRQVFKLKSSFAMGIISRLPGWLFHPQNNVILEDDVIFLHRQMVEFAQTGSSDKPLGQAYRMPYSSDAFVAAFHNWMRKWGGHGPFGPMDKEWLKLAGPQLTQEQLLDRYDTHTKDCRSCATALKTLNSAQRILAAVGIAAAAASCLGTTLMALGASSFGKTAAISVASAAAAAASHSTATQSLPQQAAASLAAALQAISPGTQAATVISFIGLAIVCALLWVFAGNYKKRYIKGTWPPPRNVLP